MFCTTDDFKKEDPDKVLDWVISLAEENVKYNESDSMNQMVLSQILNVAASRNTKNQERFEYYWQRAMSAMDKSIEAYEKAEPALIEKLLEVRQRLMDADLGEGIETEYWSAGD